MLVTDSGLALRVARDLPGDRFRACIRPEDVILYPEGTEGENRLPGEVLVTTFLGRNIQYNVRTAIGEFVIKAEQEQGYSVGSRVSLELTANKIILIQPHE